jgi:hydroxymethylpyrimidine/phosphomethylpyrimidine kinase
MPDRDVKTIQDLIFYQYAKVVAATAQKEHTCRSCHRLREKC